VRCLLRFELSSGVDLFFLALSPRTRIPSEHPRISSTRRTKTLASNQAVQLPDATMKTLFGDLCRKCS